jgi:stearoyl-CoA desaturase (delta-9 desaturase)
VLDESLADSRRDAAGSRHGDLAAPWFVQESPAFYAWLRETYMAHMLAQAVGCALLWGLPGFVWGFVVSVAWRVEVLVVVIGAAATMHSAVCSSPLLIPLAHTLARIYTPLPPPKKKIRVLVTQNMTWLVNSAVHVWGTAPYKSGDASRNNWLVALLVFGDGWHNNHHVRLCLCLRARGQGL